MSRLCCVCTDKQTFSHEVTTAFAALGPHCGLSVLTDEEVAAEDELKVTECVFWVVEIKLAVKFGLLALRVMLVTLAMPLFEVEAVEEFKVDDKLALDNVLLVFGVSFAAQMGVALLTPYTATVLVVDGEVSF